MLIVKSINPNYTKVKILNINPEEIQKELQKLGFEKTFEGWIKDFYWDDKEHNLDKQKKIIRTRIKKWENNKEKIKITFKDKNNKDKNYKIAQEVEISIKFNKPIYIPWGEAKYILENFLNKKNYIQLLEQGEQIKISTDWIILSAELIQDNEGRKVKLYIRVPENEELQKEKILFALWLIPIRGKKKYRITFKKEENWDKVKVVLDKYNKIPRILEIEAQNPENIEKYIKLLWLQNHERTNIGSRWFFKWKRKYIYLIN